VKIAVIGTGAMGSIYAAKFADAGHDVWAIDSWEEHIQAIARSGLRIESPNGDQTVSIPNSSTRISDAMHCDLYILATKGSGVASAAREIAKVMSPSSLVLTIQNGLGASERIATHIDSESVVLGVADGFGAAIKAPAHAYHNAMKLIRLGEMDGGNSPRLTALEKLWTDAGFNAQAYEDIHQLIWEKFICNVALSGPCALFNCSIGELLENPDSRKVAIGCMLEAYDIGLRKKISFSFDDPVSYLETFVARMPDAFPSMLQDYRARRKTELDAINGIVPLMGAEFDVSTPYNETVAGLIRATEQTY